MKTNNIKLVTRQDQKTQTKQTLCVPIGDRITEFQNKNKYLTPDDHTETGSRTKPSVSQLQPGAYQRVKQTFRVSCPPLNEGGSEGGTVHRPPEAWWHSRFCFFSHLVAISFPNRIDVWVRL